MDVVREEQAAFREEMDSVKSKIEQIFEAIQALARREEEARVAAAARNDALVQGVVLQSGPSVPIPNPVIYGLPPGFVPPPERNHVPPPAHTSGVADGVPVQGPPIVNQVVMPRTDEELQDEFEMQNYNGATLVVIPTAAQDSEAILMCPAAQYPTMPYRPIAHVPIPVPVPQYQAPQPQFQAPLPQHQQRNQQNNQPRPVQQQRPNQQRPYQQYNNVNTTPIPMSYTQLLPYLIQNGTVVPRALPPMPKPHKPCTKAVPWNYEPVVYMGNKPVILKEPDVTNIAGASGVTRSGRVFSPEVIPNKESAPTVEPIKGKEVNPPEVGEGSSKKAVTAEEDREFLKIIKKSDYK
ncbi:hypothetical protein KIW84_042725 [Lathyrus oleraceus]|uniref:Uncharacterized protein n=1 Tax=Pisum sativum TaxID=3888 RepID=A0A9D4XBR8_PEA|nr:hypothetical protein KIW84_042725 [Pisum sativum]